MLGILGASLSSAMGALLGAPRTLQSLAQDAILPRLLGRGYGEGKDPRLATVVAFVIALLGILLGDLNAIAPVLSMFFLTSYAVLNLSAGLEGLIGGPAWRPSFHVPWWVSILGFVACVAAMLMIDPGSTFVALLVTAAVYHSVRRRSLNAQWGDVRYGALILLARLALDGLSRRQPHARSWNPNVLALTGVPTTRWHLVVIARALAGEAGLLTVATVLSEGPNGRHDRIDGTRKAIEGHLASKKISALVKVVTDADVVEGLMSLVKSYGFGPLTPNTVVLGKSATPDDAERHAALLMAIQRRKLNLIVVHEGEDLPELQLARRIDLWWRGLRDNLGLMLALAFLLKKQPAWADADVVVWQIVATEDEVAPTSDQLRKITTTARFDAKVMVVCEPDQSLRAIRRHSRQADLLFLGLRAPEADEDAPSYAAYYANLVAQTDGLPPTVLVGAGEPVDLHRLFVGGV